MAVSGGFEFTYQIRGLRGKNIVSTSQVFTLGGTPQAPSVTLEVGDSNLTHPAKKFMELASVGIPYMITGSFVSNIHGRPRATQDADIAIEVQQKTLKKILENFVGATHQSVPVRLKD